MADIRHFAPWPNELEDLVNNLAYRPGWKFHLIADHDRGDGTHGTTLDIVTNGYDSYHVDRGETYRVHHYVHVPAATYNTRSWLRWLFEEILKIERHEAMEFFAIDGVRPFAPNHGPGNDPYYVVQYAEDEDRRTSFRGDVKEAS